MTAKALCGEFEDELDRLVSAFTNMVSLHSRSLLATPELEYAVEALAIRAMATFESFIREVFLDAVAGTADLRRVRSYIDARDHAHAVSIAYAGSERLPWLPLSKTLDRSHRLLKYGQPFSRLELRSLGVIERARIVRNRIAHDGEEAKRLYEKQIMQGDQSFARPAKWLLHDGGGGQTNLSVMVDRLGAAAEAISVDYPRLDTLLGPVEERDSGSIAPAGRYRCFGCRRVQSLPQRSKLHDVGSCVSKCSWRLELLYGL